MNKVLALAGAGILMLAVAVWALLGETRGGNLSGVALAGVSSAPKPPRTAESLQDELTKELREAGYKIGLRWAKFKEYGNRIYCFSPAPRMLTSHPLYEEHQALQKVMAEAAERGCLSHVNQVNRAPARK